MTFDLLPTNQKTQDLCIPNAYWEPLWKLCYEHDIINKDTYIKGNYNEGHYITSDLANNIAEKLESILNRQGIKNNQRFIDFCKQSKGFEIW